MNILQRIRRFFSNMFSKKDIETALDVKIAISEEMRIRQELWRNIFNGRAPWNDEKIKSTKTAKSVCKKVAKLVTLNLESEITGSETADFLNKQYKRVVNVSGKNGFRATVEKGNKNGTLVARVFLRNFVKKAKGFNEGDLFVEFFETDMFLPIAFDEQGNLIDGAFQYAKRIDEKYYTLLERCTYIRKEKLFKISYSVWVSNDRNTLGEKAHFTDVKDWADLKESYPYENVEKPWFAMFVMPEIGTEEERSPMGSALFANAIEELQKADEAEELTDHEFKAGRLMQNASSDILSKDPKTNEYIIDKDVFNVFEGSYKKDGTSQGFLDTYNPTFRDEALRRRQNDINRAIETAISIAHGTISDIQVIQRTATEILHGREDTGSTVKEIQDGWQPVLTDIVDIMYDMATRFNLCPKGKYNVSFWWNDSIVVTQEEKQEAFNKELQRMIQLRAINVISDAEIRAFYEENSDYFSKLTPEMIQKAQQELPGAFEDENIIKEE